MSETMGKIQSQRRWPSEEQQKIPPLAADLWGKRLNNSVFLICIFNVLCKGTSIKNRKSHDKDQKKKI